MFAELDATGTQVVERVTQILAKRNGVVLGVVHDPRCAA